MKKEFPKYQSHNAVYCFQCGRHIESRPVKTDYPTGIYQKICECGFSTWYDLDTFKLPNIREEE